VREVDADLVQDGAREPVAGEQHAHVDLVERLAVEERLGRIGRDR
jgi:hypothetical protein